MLKRLFESVHEISLEIWVKKCNMISNENDHIKESQSGFWNKCTHSSNGVESDSTFAKSCHAKRCIWKLDSNLVTVVFRKIKCSSLQGTWCYWSAVPTFSKSNTTLHFSMRKWNFPRIDPLFK